MADYTITTSPAQEAILTWAVNQHNVQQDSALTNAQYVQAAIPALIAPFAEAYKQYIVGALQSQFLAADAATQQQIKSLLKIS